MLWSPHEKKSIGAAILSVVCLAAAVLLAVCLAATVFLVVRLAATVLLGRWFCRSAQKLLFKEALCTQVA